MREDHLLRMIVDFANHGAMSFGIMLQIKGLVVSGTAISVNEYLTAFAKVFTDGIAGAMFQVENWEGQGVTDVEIHQIRNVLNKRLLDAADLYKTQIQAEIEPKEFSDYIHLKNPFYVLPAEKLIGVGDFPYWRFAIEDISGWTLGSWEETEG